MSKRPTVSVITITYNQEAFIRQALESFVAQKTNFEFEVLVSDDCSTDGTPAIVAEFAKRYPTIIKPILRKKNLGSMPNFVDTLRQSKGKYVAICEGDDYWTNTEKLQKQVDFLEDHAGYALCFHPVRIAFENSEEADAIFPKDTSGFTTKKLLEHNFIQTNSVLYRRQNYDAIPTDIMPGDWYMHLYHASFGKVGFINEVMAVYRRHAGGLWWNQRKRPELIWAKYGYGFVRLLHKIMQLYGHNKSYRKIINNHIVGTYEAIAAVKPQSVADKVATDSIASTPTETWDYIKHLMQQIAEGAEREAHLRTLVERKAITNNRLSDDNRRLSEELRGIKSSKLWKAMRVARFGSYSARHPVQGVRRVARHISARAKRH